jgi:hypothetical protein
MFMSCPQSADFVVAKLLLIYDFSGPTTSIRAYTEAVLSQSILRYGTFKDLSHIWEVYGPRDLATKIMQIPRITLPIYVGL